MYIHSLQWQTEREWWKRLVFRCEKLLLYFSGLSFFLSSSFFLTRRRKTFWFRASIPQMLIYFLFFFSSSFALALHLDYAVSLRMVKKEHGVWLDLAHRRLTSSVYLITGQTGKRDQQSARRRLRTQKKSRKWETRAVSRCCFTHTRVKKKEGEEEKCNLF